MLSPSFYMGHRRFLPPRGHGVLFGKGAAQGMHGHCPLSLPMRESTTSHGKQRAAMPLQLARLLLHRRRCLTCAGTPYMCVLWLNGVG